MNTKIGKKAKNDFEKDYFRSMNNAVFGKTINNIEIINFLQQMGEEIIEYHNQIMILKCFSGKTY